MGLTECKVCQNGKFGLLGRLTMDSEEVKGGTCMRGSDGKLCFIERDRSKV